jgi:hypothetical protein
MKNITKLALACLMLISRAALYAQSCMPTITTGLEAEYNFTGNANDASGNGNNGTVYNATLTTDRFGNANSAYSFNGSSDSILVPNSSSLQFTSGNQTISFWINVPSLPNPANNNGAIFDKYDQRLAVASTGDSGEGFYVCFAQLGNGTISYGVAGGKPHNGVGVSVSNTLLAANKWENIVFVYNKTKDSAYAYLNGALVNQALIPTGMTIGQNTMPLRIGACDMTSNGFHSPALNGMLDDIRLYDVVLNSCSIDSLYTTGTVCHGIAKKYTLDSVSSGSTWSWVELPLPDGAKLDSIYGGFARPGYSGSSLSYSAYSYGGSNNVDLLNTTNSTFSPYTGPYDCVIN